MDFMSDELYHGWLIRILTIVDHFISENPAMLVDSSIGACRVVETLPRLSLQERKTQTISLDNGTESTSQIMDQWAYLNGVVLDFRRPDKPTDYSFIEAFNSRLTAECLNENWFLSLEDDREKIEEWPRYYNGERPHGALGNHSPKTFALLAPVGAR